MLFSSSHGESRLWLEAIEVVIATAAEVVVKGRVVEDVLASGINRCPPRVPVSLLFLHGAIRAGVCRREPWIAKVSSSSLEDSFGEVR